MKKQTTIMEKPNYSFSELLKKHSWPDGTIDRISAMYAMKELQSTFEAYAKFQYEIGKRDGLLEAKAIFDNKA